MDNGILFTNEESLPFEYKLGFVWSMKPGKSASDKKKPKKRKATNASQPGDSLDFDLINSERAKRSGYPPAQNAKVSTKMLPDGSQFVESTETVAHTDGSTVETKEEETIKKRTVTLPDGTRVLETTTTTITTKTERTVLPSEAVTEELTRSVNETPQNDSVHKASENEDKSPKCKPTAAAKACPENKETDSLDPDNHDTVNEREPQFPTESAEGCPG